MSGGDAGSDGGGQVDPAAMEELVSSFCAVTSATRQEALFFLESHNFAVDDAVRSFFDAADEENDETLALPQHQQPPQSTTNPRSRSQPHDEDDDEEEEDGGDDDEDYVGPTPAPPPVLRRPEKKKQKKAAAGSGSGVRGGAANIRTLADLGSRRGDDEDEEDDDDEDWNPEEEDEGEEYYTGGEKSGMLVQDPSKGKNNADAIFDQARRRGAGRGPFQPQSSSSRSFTGTGRLLSGDTVQAAAQQPENVVHNICLWSNGFTVNDGPLRRIDDPSNAAFLESIRKSECPEELDTNDGKTEVTVKLIHREGNCPEPVKQHSPFQGSRRTLGSEPSDNSVPTLDTTADLSNNVASPTATCPTVDDSLPSTSLQIRFADGTRTVARFNTHNTIGDVRVFIDSSMPGVTRNYSLQVGFPPKALDDMTKTIQEAGVASSVIIQKL